MTKIGSFNGLSDYEFTDYSYDISSDNEELVYLDTEFSIIHILSNDVFYIKYDNNNIYYLVIGDKKI